MRSVDVCPGMKNAMMMVLFAVLAACGGRVGVLEGECSSSTPDAGAQAAPEATPAPPAVVDAAVPLELDAGDVLAIDAAVPSSPCVTTVDESQCPTPAGSMHPARKMTCAFETYPYGSLAAAVGGGCDPYAVLASGGGTGTFGPGETDFWCCP